jgi:pimeloyl-ACP methyl ester carboxylesterase
MDAPRIQYAKTSDGVDIAFTVFGQGTPLVSAPSLPSSHLQMEWDVRYTRAQLEGLAERAMVVRYDPRGVGMSQRDAVDFSPEAMVLDLDAVVGRLGLERFALLGGLTSGNIPFVYPARRPERVSHLVLVWAGSTGSTSRDEEVSAVLRLMEEQWKLFTNIFARLVQDWDSPDATPLASQFRAAHSPQSFRLAREAVSARTPEAFAHEMKAPTLIMHRIGDSVSAGMASTLASQITGAQVAGIPGLPGLRLNAVGITALHDFISTKPSAPGQSIAAPELDTKAPHGMVKVYPRRIDLENVEKLKSFESTQVVESLEDLTKALAARLACLNISFS